MPAHAKFLNPVYVVQCPSLPGTVTVFIMPSRVWLWDLLNSCYVSDHVTADWFISSLPNCAKTCICQVVYQQKSSYISGYIFRYISRYIYLPKINHYQYTHNFVWIFWNLGSPNSPYVSAPSSSKRLNARDMVPNISTVISHYYIKRKMYVYFVWIFFGI